MNAEQGLKVARDALEDCQVISVDLIVFAIAAIFFLAAILGMCWHWRRTCDLIDLQHCLREELEKRRTNHLIKSDKEGKK